jgi:hypothetical protein
MSRLLVTNQGRDAEPADVSCQERKAETDGYPHRSVAAAHDISDPLTTQAAADRTGTSEVRLLSSRAGTPTEARNDTPLGWGPYWFI